jgi:hypothetical protein
LRIKTAVIEAEMVPGEAVADDVAALLKAFLTRPLAFYISDFKSPIADGPAEFRAGLLLGTGEQTAKFKGLLERYQLLLSPDAVQRVKIGGETFYRIKFDPDLPQITWGAQGNYLLAAVGEGEIEAMLQRMKGEPPAWLVNSRKQVPAIPRTAVVAVLNVKLLLEGLGVKEKAKNGLFRAMGVSNVTELISVSGLDEKAFVAHTLVRVEGGLQGLFRLLSGKPVGAAELNRIPRDATLACAFRLDPKECWDVALELAELIEPQMKKDLQRGASEMAEELGIRFSEDILGALGNSWTIFDSASEGGILWGGLMVAGQLRDPKQSATTHQKLREAIKANLSENPFGFRSELKEFTHAGRTVFVATGHSAFPFAPSWCLTDKEILFALYPQAIRAYLSRGPDFQSLAKVPEVAKLLERGGGTPLAISYLDSQRLFDSLYPLVKTFANALFTYEMGGEALKLDIALLPAAGSIHRHLTSDVTCVRQTPAGLEITSRCTLPGAGLPTLLPMLPYWLMWSGVNGIAPAAKEPEEAEK